VSEERLGDRLDRAVAGTDLGPTRTPLWQRAVGGLQWLLVLTALVGALWLLLLVALGYLRLDDVVPLPRVEGFPLPTLLLVGGCSPACCSPCSAARSSPPAPAAADGARRRGWTTPSSRSPARRCSCRSSAR
jgi:hypothetical protein